MNRITKPHLRSDAFCKVVNGVVRPHILTSYQFGRISAANRRYYSRALRRKGIYLPKRWPANCRAEESE